MKLAPPPCAECEHPTGIPLLVGMAHICGTCGMAWGLGWFQFAANTPPDRAKRLRELSRGRA